MNCFFFVFCFIRSLQLKVKKLEEEEKDGDDVRSINDETEPTRLNRETNESSTASVDKIADHERLSRENSKNPDPNQKAATATTEEEEGTVSRRLGMSHCFLDFLNYVEIFYLIFLRYVIKFLHALSFFSNLHALKLKNCFFFQIIIIFKFFTAEVIFN